MAVNYNDERFGKVETEKNQALSALEKTYGDMINESDAYYQAQIDASKEWADKQAQIQQAQTDHTINVIEQEKAQTTKDYKREQSGAYVDWQKESNRYGANAEYMAANGMAGSGYSESSQVSMYNTYQNRVATARESWQLAIQNYNNQITEARLQNSAALAEIAYSALQQQLELSLAGFQYKNDLIREKEAQKQNLNNTYYARYQDVLDQINTENAMAEQIRQYNQNYDLDLKKYNESVRQFNAQMAEEKRQYDASLAENKRQYNETLKAQQAAQSASISRSSGGSSSSSKISRPTTLTKAVQKSGGSSGSSSKVHGGGGKKLTTEYYQGSYNKDGNKYGTFSNGYQPKGISGHGTVSKTGDTLTFQTKTLSGKKQTVTQNIWKASDGTKWYWEGRENKYKRIK